MCAKVNGQVSWVRRHKNELSNYNSWGRRAIMFAGSVLSRDERKHWMELVENTSSSLLERILAKYV
jgi:hypothetical protein